MTRVRLFVAVLLADAAVLHFRPAWSFYGLLVALGAYLVIIMPALTRAAPRRGT